MDFKYNFSGGNLTVYLEGEIDEYCCRTLRARLDALIDERRPSSVVLDLGGVTFVDSTGLGLILGRYKKLKAAGGTLSLRAVDPHVDKVFRTSGVYKYAPKIEER